MRLPRPDLNEQADNCLLMARGDAISPHWLVYEVHRDFLSAPRCFAVVKLESDYDFDWLGDEFTEGLRCLDAGESETLSGSDRSHDHPPEPHWRISLPRLRFECWGRPTLVETCYGAASASEALIRVLSPDC